MGHPVDKLFGGLIIAGIITMLILFGLTMLPVPVLGEGLGLRQVVLGVAMTSLLMIPRPALLRTVWRERRSPFLLDADLDCLLIGRGLGLLWGVLASVWLYRVGS